MISLLQERPTLAHDIFQRAMKKAFDERLRPPQPIRTFSAADAGKAFHQFQVLDAPGKNIIEINSDTIVMADVKTIPRCKLYPDATYVISGGLGGLGRSITRWMVDRGARNLILLSRSGVKSQEAKNLIRYLEGRQICVVTPAVDISNLVALKHVLKPLEKTMPPIRGCIQATVALRDNLFPNMTYCDWIVGTNSKAKGSWNLHSVLPCGLDFFVLFASLNGILGGRAQANYAAGNTFKDALAHYRISLGEKAISIDLGLMASEGIVAENADLLASMRRIGHLMDINQEELIALLDYYCDSALPILSHDKAQILVGLETPGAIRAKGIDIHHAIHRPLFQQLFSLDSGSLQSPGQQTTISYAMVLKEATSREEASAMVTGWLQAKIAHTLGLQEEDVDPTKPIHTYGIDSLVAIDLKNWFSKEIGADIKVFFMLGNQTLEAVAREAVKGSKFMVQ
ncbi:Lovastatin diketide synthase LovF [Daldinia childiae]|nr:Lovastatin diketide synthase LovF [Daldinia childiae]KAF3055049.1 Lovastatin diketide synthase LovF [Daldinia childiae]